MGDAPQTAHGQTVAQALEALRRQDRDRLEILCAGEPNEVPVGIAPTARRLVLKAALARIEVSQGTP